MIEMHQNPIAVHDLQTALNVCVSLSSYTSTCLVAKCVHHIS